MVILNSKKPSESSSTASSDSPSDDDKKRFYKQPSGPRQTSSSSSSESDNEESSGDGETPASGVSQPKKAPQAKVRDPSPSVKAKKESKRNREEVGGQEQAPAKRKSIPKKTDTGKKPSPPLQRETLSKGTAEKIPAKSAKEKKSSASKDEKNPRRQQIVQEAAASTPGKKAQHVWSDKDEMAFANALLASSKQGIDVSKNLSQLHQDLKDSMEYEYTKGQLYEKLRRLKNKYHTTVEKLKEGNVKEDSFPFKTPHEKSIFRICKQLWYEDEEMAEEAPPEDAGRSGNPEARLQEGDVHDNAGGDSGEEEDDQEDGDHTVSAQQNVKVSRNVNGSAVQQDDKMALVKELSELRTDCMKLIEAAEARTVALVEKQLKSARENLHRGDGGIRTSPAFSIINRDLMDGILAAGDFPLLDGAQAEKLEQKWREQNIVEMEAFSRRLDLLQEECKMYLAALKSPTGSDRP